MLVRSTTCATKLEGPKQLVTMSFTTTSCSCAKTDASSALTATPWLPLHGQLSSMMATMRTKTPTKDTEKGWCSAGATFPFLCPSGQNLIDSFQHKIYVTELHLFWWTNRFSSWNQNFLFHCPLEDKTFQFMTFLKGCIYQLTTYFFLVRIRIPTTDHNHFF